MARKKKHEDHVNHEAWAIPYGDLITLLLAFFVVMYAISSVNEGKYRQLSESMVAAFRGTPRTTQPIQIGDNRPVGDADQGANPMSELGLSDPRTLQLPREVVQEACRSSRIRMTPAPERMRPQAMIFSKWRRKFVQHSVT